MIFLDRCIFSAVSPGTVDFVVAAALQGYQTPTAAAAVNGQTYQYAAQSADLSQWEVGTGVWTAGGATLSRATVLFNNLGTTAKVNFSAPPLVMVTALAEDIAPALGTLPSGAPIADADVSYWQQAGSYVKQAASAIWNYVQAKIVAAFNPRTVLNSAASFYVSTTGSDSNPGTLSQPWATAQHAAEVVEKFDLNGYNVTVYFEDGTYEGFDINGAYSSRVAQAGFTVGFQPQIIFTSLSADYTKVSLTYPTVVGSIVQSNSCQTAWPTLSNVTLDGSINNQDGTITISTNYSVLMIGGDGSSGTVRFIGEPSPGTAGDGSYVDTYSQINWNDNIIFDGGQFDFAAYADDTGLLLVSYWSACSITCALTPHFGGGFAIVGAFYRNGNVIFLAGTTFSGAATGPRFSVAGGIVDVSPISGSNVNTLPGNSAGAVSDGGQYRYDGGTYDPVISSANSTFIQVPEPTSAPTAALAGAGAGNVDNGTHYYAVLFVLAAGQTALGPASSAVTVIDKMVNGKVSLTSIPIGPAGTTARKIYRTSGIQNVRFQLLTTIADNTTTTYTDNTADAGLGNGNQFSNTTAGAVFDSGGAQISGYSNNAFGFGEAYELILPVNTNGLLLTDPTFGSFGQVFAGSADGGIQFLGYATAGSPLTFNGFALYGPLGPTDVYNHFTAINGPGFPVDGETIAAFDFDYAFSGGQPAAVIVTGGPNDSGGFPIDGVRIGINVNAPTAIVDVANVATGGTAKVVSRFAGMAGQTGDLAQWTDNSHTVLASVSSVGVVKGSGFSAGSSAGISATITTAKLTPGGTNGSMTFTDGLLTAQTPAT